jgi:hypothetical protein
MIGVTQTTGILPTSPTPHWLDLPAAPVAEAVHGWSESSFNAAA